MTIQNRALFLRGFRAVLPICAAGIPFALIYVISAQRAGLSAAEIQITSLMVYSAAGQIAFVQLLAVNAPVVTIFITMILMHLHFLMYGLSLSKQISFSRFEAIFMPFFLTDVVYGVTIAETKKSSIAFMLGAEMAIFLSWNFFTGLAIVLGDKLINPLWGHLDFIAPLTFFALLVLLIKSRLDGLLALFAMILTGISITLGFGSLTIIIVSLISLCFGIAITRYYGAIRL